MSIQRLEKCVQIAKLYEQRKVRIVLSGGFGHHFNPSDQPHSLIQEKYLSEHLDLDPDVIGKGATGLFDKITNTVEEAIALYNELVCPDSIFHNAEEIIVVTSPFHFARSKYLLEIAHAKTNLHRPKLSMVACEPVPERDDNTDQDDITFLDPSIPKIKQIRLYRYFMAGLSERQKHALDKYEEAGLLALRNNPYGAWLDFIEHH